MKLVFVVAIVLQLLALSHGALTLGGVMKTASPSGATGCSFVHIDPNNANVTTIATVDALCKDASDKFGLPMTTAVNSTMFFMTGTGKFIYTVDMKTGAYAVYAPLPASYDFTVGLTYSNDMLFWVTTTSIYGIPARGAAPKLLLHFTDFKLTEDSVVTSNADDLFIVNGGTMYRVQLKKAYRMWTTTLGNPLSRVMDLQYFAANDKLIMLDSYQLYSVDPKSGVATNLCGIPNGPGFPRVNVLYQSSFYWADFTHMHLIDVVQAKVIGEPLPLDAIKLVGYFQYFV